MKISISKVKIKATVMSIKIGIGKLRIGAGGSQNWESEWAARSLFWSDGTIAVDKLGVKYGTGINAPTLVDSNCLTMDVNDTIAFTSLDGWSIVSKEGTAVIEVNGNNILCTGAGTLYNLILYDGTINHYYPLAEGGATTAFDTSDSPSHGTIVCADLTWSLQSTFHKNIQGHNIRLDVPVYNGINFVDSDSNGIPDGFVDTWGKGGITTANGVVRCTVNEGMTQKYHQSVYKSAVLTVGVTYRAKIRARASADGLGICFYMGNSSANTSNIVLTTEWVTYTSTFKAAVAGNCGVVNVSNLVVGNWFEFSEIEIAKQADSHYVPKMENADTDVHGNAVSVLGNGYFIDAETKLLFPNNANFLATDDRMNFFYDEVAGTQLKKSYSDIHPNVFNYKPCDRIFCKKVDGRLTELLILDVSKTYTRDQFITLLEYFNLPTYIFTKITKGALLFCFTGGLPESAESIAARAVMNPLGASVVNLQTQDSLVSTVVNQYNAFLDAGNYLWTVMNGNKGNLADDLLAGEEDEFAAEIASGELIVVDSPGGARGAFPKIDYPSYVVPANLVNTTKTNGTVILTTQLNGYNQLVWIPAGQSGVPAALEEIPLWVNPYDSYKLYYYKWEASAFFGVTFTNGDAINVYKMLNTQYTHLVSTIGLKCIMKHLRNYFEQQGIRYLAGYWETPNGPNFSFRTIGSNAGYDAGMRFGTANTGLHDWMANQNNPRDWIFQFRHNWADWPTDDLATILSDLDGIAAANTIAGSQNEAAWDASWFNAIWAKCQTLGIIVMSPADFIRNVRFNDY